LLGHTELKNLFVGAVEQQTHLEQQNVVSVEVRTCVQKELEAKADNLIQYQNLLPTIV
jgi:hypothetical protein